MLSAGLVQGKGGAIRGLELLRRPIPPEAVRDDLPRGTTDPGGKCRITLDPLQG
jgi:hypothetical protein